MKSDRERWKSKLDRANAKIRILEDMMETRTRELYLKNEILQRQKAEIEEFAYIASHDLQEPLQTITGFIKLLTEYGNTNQGDTLQYLYFVKESTERMSALVKDLLAYSVIGTEKNYIPVDCSMVAAEVIRDLDYLVKSSRAQIRIGKLPVVPGIPTEIRQLFQNLIQNAIKFRSPDLVPEVSVRAEKMSDEIRFRISDNGIGIDPALSSRVFRIFQRLHTRDKYEGTGIGLSLCKKIVEHHGGRIKIIPNVERGTTVEFTLKHSHS